MSTELRAHPRITVEVAAELTIGNYVVAAATQNISEGGVGLVLDRALEDGQTVDVTLFLTQDGIEDPDEEPFETKATVAWTAPSENGTHLAGVRFGAVSAAQKAQLTRFLAAVGD